MAFQHRVMLGLHVRGVSRHERWHRQQQVEQALVDLFAGEVFDLRLALGTHHVDGVLDEIAHHGLHITPDITDLGELRGLHFGERRPGQLGQTPRNLGFPHARRADEDDVIRRDFLSDGFRGPLTAPTIAQRDRHRLLGVSLADDVAIQLRHDLPRREVGKPSDGLLGTGRGHAEG